MVHTLPGIRCQVHGFTYFEYNRLPPNVTFEIDDVESEWQFSRPFDFIHARYMAGAIADWPKLMHQCYELSAFLESKRCG